MSKNEELSNEILNKYPLTQTRCNEIIRYYPKLVSKIPIEFITIDMCIYLIKTDPLLIDYIPKEVMTNKMYYEIIKKEPKLITYIPKKYQTKEMWDITISKYPFYIAYIKPEFITEKMIQNTISNHPKLIKHINKKYITEKTYINIVINNPSLISEIPQEYITQKLCDYVTNKDIKLIDIIPKQFITSKMCNKALDSLKKHENAILIKYVNPEELTEDICIFVASSQPNLIKYIPKKYITLNFILKIIDNIYESYIKFIPFEHFKEKEREIIIEKILNKNPEAIIKFIPKKYLTKTIAEKLVKSEPSLINSLPKELITKEMLEYINSKNLYKKEKIQKMIDIQLVELTILKELTIMLSSGGSIEEISKKNNISINLIQEIIEKQKDTNPELYEAIKNKLLSNQTIWVLNMINDCNILSKIIRSLGNINNAFLTREQKIKFAYLYYNYCHNSLENIYEFANKYPDKIEDVNTINEYFRKVLKFNYLKNENTLIPEKKTILFNNKWLKQFDKNDYFKIKDGIPTVKNQYLEHIISTEDVDNIVITLKNNNIPLNDMIVKEAIREYYNKTLNEYINNLQLYDTELNIDKPKGRI